ncbi:MAG TPA: MIP/aquaporin family protein [Chloroflexaceae bacterium]|nr:MIP/aquaporin family protein [Chloroflexaceae bacterium]
MSPFLGEIVGTFLLVLLGDAVVAGVLLNRSKSQNGGWIVITVAWAMAVFVGAYSVAAVSGAHLNPAVTIGLATAGNFGTDFFTGWGDVPIYIAGQMIGAFLGAVVVWLHYFPHWAVTEDPGLKLAVFSTGPAIPSPLWNLVSEIIGTFVLVFGILAIKGFTIADATGAAFDVNLGALGIIPVALLVLVIGLSLGGTTGYAINPARDLGPRIAHAILPIPGKGSSDWGYSWVPVVGPIIGAVIAGLLYVGLGRF